MKLKILGFNTLLVCWAMMLILSCKKDKPADDPIAVADPTFPSVTSMRYYRYNGLEYTDGFKYYNPYILNNLGVANSVILINGHNFSQNFKESSVLFNNLKAVALDGDSTRIVVMIPDDVVPGPVTLTINTNGKTFVHPTKFTIEASNPQIAAVSSEAGMVGGKLIIYGSDFATTVANNKVTINGVSATVDSAHLTAVYVNIPANSASGKIVLTSHNIPVTYKNDFKTTASTFSILNPGTAGFGPQNLALDAAGNLYGTIANTVYKILPNGTTTVFAQIPAQPDAVPFIAGCAVDASGNVFIASPYVSVLSRASIYINGPAKIYKITTAGVLSVFAGSDYTGHTDGQGTKAVFYSPKTIAFDPSGNLIVNDVNSVRKITPDGTVSTVANIYVGAMAVDAKTGSIYSLGTTGVSTTTFFGQLTKIAPDGSITTTSIDPMPDAIIPAMYPGVQTYSPAASFITIDASGNIFAVVGVNVYKIKNTSITNTYLNPSTGKIIGLALDASGKIYLTLPVNLDQQSNYDKFVVYKVTP